MRLRRLLEPAVAMSLIGLLSSLAIAGTAVVTVNADQPGHKISPDLYGIFFEDINRSVDGGIYAEMVQNRSFEDAQQPKAWSVVSGGGAEARMAVDKSQPVSANSANTLRVEITKAGVARAGVANDGFGGMPLKAGSQYSLSFFARCDDDFKGTITATLESKDGSKVYSKRQIDGIKTTWGRYTCTFTADDSDLAGRLVLSTTAPGSIWFDTVSLFPKDTYKGRPNGFRADLLQMLIDLKPAFNRFPGGCYVEGDTLATSYRWKQTIGDVSERPGRPNLWKYYSSDGIGYHEYLQMTEDIGAVALFVVNCGMSHKQNVPMDQLQPWVQDALDAIEYANGPADSKWGSVRAKAGHPAPFNLKYIEIGNENGGKAYEERYAVFYDAIKKAYPNVQIIADEWGGLPGSRPVEIVDEHYYSTPEFFISQANKYDKYPRTGPKIYVGEYAVTQGTGKGSLMGAIGEAAFMTGMERNSDIVIMSSYAPLFVRMDTRSWNPDLINFDNTRAYGIPSFHVQKMFANNLGDTVLPLAIKADAAKPKPRQGAVGVGTWATQAEYKDITITSGDKVLAQCDFATSATGWKPTAGKWEVQAGAYRQTDNQPDRRSVFGDASWGDITYSLKARKLSGAEGFLVMFHVKDNDNYAWWNIGGWGNSRHTIEVASGGGKSQLGSSVTGKIETGRWYDIRIEVKGLTVKCFLDGKLMHEAEYGSSQPLYAVASRDSDKGEVILKVVNVSADSYTTEIRLDGVKSVQGPARVTALTSAKPTDENTLDEPTKVAPTARQIDNVKPTFEHTFPPYSVTVMRVKAQ